MANNAQRQAELDALNTEDAEDPNAPQASGYAFPPGGESGKIATVDIPTPKESTTTLAPLKFKPDRKAELAAMDAEDAAQPPGSPPDITSAVSSALMPQADQHLPYDPNGIVDKYKDMGDFMRMPSLWKEVTRSPMALLGMIGSDADSFEKIIQKNYPKITIRHDEDGNILMKDPEDKKKEYIFKRNSFQQGDAIRALMGAGLGIGGSIAGAGAAAVGTALAPEALLGAAASAPAWLSGTGTAILNQYALSKLRSLAGGAPVSPWEIIGAAGLHMGFGKAHQWWRGPEPGPQTAQQLSQNAVAAARGSSAATDSVLGQMQPNPTVVQAADRLGVGDSLTPGQASGNPIFQQMSATAMGDEGDKVRVNALRRVSDAFEKGIKAGDGPGSQDAIEAIRKNSEEMLAESAEGVKNAYKPETTGIPNDVPTPVNNLIAKIDAKIASYKGADVPRDLMRIRARLVPAAERVAAGTESAASKVPIETIRVGHGSQAIRPVTDAEAALFAAQRNEGRLALRGGVDTLQDSDQITKYGRFRTSPIAEAPRTSPQARPAPEWGVVDDVMKDLGASSKGKPPYKSLQASGVLGDFLKAGKIDQQLAADAVSPGAGAKFVAAQLAHQEHLALKSAYRDVMANVAKRGLAGEVLPAIGLLGNGVPDAYNKAMSVMRPKDRVTATLAGMYQFIKESATGDTMMDARKYVSFMDGLERNEASKNALYRHLPDAFKQTMKDTYDVTKAILESSRITPGAFEHEFKDRLSPMDRLKSAATAIPKAIGFVAMKLPAAFGFDVAGDLIGKPDPLQPLVRKILTSPLAKEVMRRQVAGVPMSDGFVRNFMGSAPVRAFMAAAPQLARASQAQRFDYMRNALGNTKFNEQEAGK